MMDDVSASKEATVAAMPKQQTVAAGLLCSTEKMTEANDHDEDEPAHLAPVVLLRKQPIELLIKRRRQALEGLHTLLHSLSRVRHASHRLPAHVAAAFRARLQHIIGWYRVTATELVERILWYREQVRDISRLASRLAARATRRKLCAIAADKRAQLQASPDAPPTHRRAKRGHRCRRSLLASTGYAIHRS